MCCESGIEHRQPSAHSLLRHTQGEQCVTGMLNSWTMQTNVSHTLSLTYSLHTSTLICPALSLSFLHLSETQRSVYVSINWLARQKAQTLTFLLAFPQLSFNRSLYCFSKLKINAKVDFKMRAHQKVSLTHNIPNRSALVTICLSYTSVILVLDLTVAIV